MDTTATGVITAIITETVKAGPTRRRKLGRGARTLCTPDQLRIHAPLGPGQPQPASFQFCGLSVFSALHRQAFRAIGSTSVDSHAARSG